MSKLNNEEFAKYLKSKGFIYQNSEIYGGLSGIYDYGHLGTSLKQKWSNQWRKFFLNLHENFVEIDTSNIMHESVFKASGHLENFFDPIAECSKCEYTHRADHLIEDQLKERAEGLSTEELLNKLKENNIKCSNCGSDYAKVENLNMMFPVDMGPKKVTRAYLRPETAQGPFVNFKTQFEIQRKKIPMGLAMIGRAYRNEISPRNLVLRTRELEQAELQIFFNPSKINEHENFDEIKDYKLKILFGNKRDKKPEMVKCSDLLKELPKFYVYHMAKVQQFYFDLMEIDPENFRFYELIGKEKAFYNKFHFDIEIKMTNPDSWIEVGGVHYRTDHDLKGHEKISKSKMEVLDEETSERFIPHVLELSFGVGRNIYSLLDQNIIVNEEDKSKTLILPPKLSPKLIGIYPLMNKDELVKIAKDIHQELLNNEIDAFMDFKGSIGKRYMREDEIGTRLGLTVDYESIEEGDNKDSFTIRDRNSKKQIRVKREEILEKIRRVINNEDIF